MKIQSIIISFLIINTLNTKAQIKDDYQNQELKKWNLNVELGAVRPGFSDSYFYSDKNNSEITSRKILEGTGFKANMGYGLNFAKRYYVGTSLGLVNYNTVFTDITTLPLSLNFKINYFKSKPNTLFFKANTGYSLPLKKIYQGLTYGYQLGYQFLASENNHHIIGISIQNQVQNIIGTLETNGVIIGENGSETPYTEILNGNYKLKNWNFNISYSF